MDENKIQKFQTVIAGLLESANQKLARNTQKETENEENALEISASTSKDEENLLEIIDYFANILVKYFYNEPQVNISLRESKFSVDQLWFFLQCVIEEKRLNRLNEFFSNLEKQLKKERRKNKKGYNGKDLKEDNGNQTDTLNQKEQEKGGFTNTGNEINLKKVPSNGDLKHTKKETKEKVKKDAKNEVKKDAKNEVKKDAKKGEKKKTKQDDPFFSYEEMENFVKEAEDKFYKEQEDSPTDDEEQEDENEKDEEFMDLNEFECNFENEKDLTYNDFFEDIEEEGKTSDGEEDEKKEIDEEEESLQQDEEEENKNEYENEEEEEENEADEEEDKEEDEEEDEEEEEEEEEDERENETEIGEMWNQEEGRAAGIERALEEESKHNRQSRKKQEMQIENAIKEINEFDDTHFNDDELSDSANEEIHDKEKIEKELIKKKHWSLTGEVFGYDRPKDSILALDVDIPKVGIFDNNDAVIKSIGKFEEDEEISNDDNDNEYEGNGNGNGGKGNKKQRNHVSMLTEEIELVVKQRIKNMLFDDVERKRIEDLDVLTNNENKDEVSFDNLNFSKSKLSLAEEYAKKYENEIKNSQSKNKEMNLQKLEMMNLFKKIMNVCDSLSNDYFIPKPVLLNTSECKVATLNIEEAVPIILAQGNKKTPEESAVKKPLKDPKEMNKREKKALRKLKKEKRKRNLLNAYKESGGINALKERNEYLSEKNKKEKEEKSNIMKYGTASKEDLSVSKSKRRFDFNAEMKKAIDYDMKKMEKRSRIE